ncbi:MAG TPA: glycosyltransferase family 4 protein [Chitinophagaceae bacterium]|nr:glycosyltransferase family 4 protein [Chitinophagaceae bacterium]
MARQKKSILIISSEFPPDPGGIGNHSFNLALFFAGEDFEVTVVADINNTSLQKVNSFRSSLPFRFKAVLRKKMAAFTYAQRLTTTVSTAASSQYIICSGKFSLWMISVLKVLYPFKKFIAVVHGTELDLKSKYAKKLTDFSLHRFRAIVAVSSYTQSFLPELVKKDIYNTVIPNGINNKEFSAYLHTRPAFVYSPQDELPVITIGNVTERKGQANVIRALPALLAVFPNLHYHIAGKPTDKERLLTLAENLGVAEHITFHGMLPRQELIALLSRCAVKFMLSNHTKDGDFEGFGIAILEANALGIPAIGSNFGGITDAISNDLTGQLVNVNDPGDITAALSRILSNYPAYAENALQWATQHDWAMIIKQYIHLLEDLN